jgi:hypothetical protein
MGYKPFHYAAERLSGHQITFQSNYFGYFMCSKFQLRKVRVCLTAYVVGFEKVVVDDCPKLLTDLCSVVDLDP